MGESEEGAEVCVLVEIDGRRYELNAWSGMLGYGHNLRLDGELIDRNTGGDA